jgi:hypothetical protein
MSIVQGGYKGLLSFSVGEGAKLTEVRDVALKAMADYAHKSPMSQKKTDNLYWLHLDGHGTQTAKKHNAAVHIKAPAKDVSDKNTRPKRPGILSKSKLAKPIQKRIKRNTPNTQSQKEPNNGNK